MKMSKLAGDAHFHTVKTAIDTHDWCGSLRVISVNVSPRSRRLLCLRRVRQVPALITVFESAGTAVTLQRHTKVARSDCHPEFP